MSSAKPERRGQAEVASPGRTANAGLAAQVKSATITIANATAMTCPTSFWRAIERRLTRRRGQQVEAALGGFAGERPDSARTDHSPSMTGSDVADAPGDEAAERVDVDRLRRAGRGRPAAGSAIWPTSSARASGVVNSVAVRRGGGEHEQRRRASPTIRAARRLSRTVLAKIEVSPMTRDHGRPRVRTAALADIGAHRRPACWPPYWARKTSSRFGSRLTTSMRPCDAAAAMTDPIGPLTRIVTDVALGP